MPTLVFNNAPVTYTMWNNYNETQKLGTWELKELATQAPLDDYGTGTNMKGYTASLGWASCYVNGLDTIAQPAYSSRYAHSTISSSRYVFNVRRQCRIWDSNNNIITYLYAGDQIITDGTSTAGQTYPDRLYINGYIKSGSTTYYDISNSQRWCDTDINIGYSTDPTVYGNW
jgi:hypothetical protein